MSQNINTIGALLTAVGGGVVAATHAILKKISGVNPKAVLWAGLEFGAAVGGIIAT